MDLHTEIAKEFINKFYIPFPLNINEAKICAQIMLDELILHAETIEKEKFFKKVKEKTETFTK